MCFGGGGGKQKQQNTSASDSANRAAMDRQNRLYEQQLAEQRAAAERARQEQAAKESRLQQGMANIEAGFKPYDDNYFSGFNQKYLDYYNPQIEDQYSKAQEQLLFGLSRAGLTNSSARGTEMGSLEKNYGTQRQGIVSAAQKYSNDARSQIAQQRTALQNQLNATGGDKITSASFLGVNQPNSVGSLPIQAPQLQSFSPLGDLFGNVSQIAVNDTRVANATGRDGLLQSAFRGMSGNKNASSYQE
jgi:hypothetical protein